jgi:3'(2'), 5'-bisphosphate nucleotidase
VDDPIPVLSRELPAVLRWGGAVARQLRRHDVAIAGKRSGSPTTDALTLADLSVQELLIAALRDMGPVVRACRIEAEETSGDLGRFARESPWVLGIDPIDGTRAYRDRTGDGYAVMLHARTVETVHYSLLYLPEEGPQGSWLEARSDGVAVGPDDVTRTAREALDALPRLGAGRRPRGRRIVVDGFRSLNEERVRAVRAAGLDAVLESDLHESIHTRFALGALGGALFHSPNVYDFPVWIHLARLFGGDAVWVHDRRPVDFRTSWLDERASMLRLPGIVACAVDRDVLGTLSDLARDWNPSRYDA